MSDPIVIKEYDPLKKSELRGCDLRGLYNYIEKQGLSHALKITPDGVEATSYVGVIKHKKLHLQILPKLICDKDDRQNILQNLIFMLSYTRKLEIKTTNDAKLSAAKNPFIEILIREYANSLFGCLKRLTPKNYVSEEDNLCYLKGKIKFAENIRLNACNQAKFYCQYDEFSENNALNQLFLFVSECLYSISKDSINKKILKFIINYYSDVELVRFDRFSAEKIRLSRNQDLFRKPFMLAKMFIEKTSVDMSKNRFDNITMLWDMNKLFEEFVYMTMKKYEHETGFNFTSQKIKSLLITADGDRKRDTKVDIMAERTSGDKEKIIIDTKYKKFEGIDDFSNADVYQVSTYCILHNAKHAILIYPQWGNKPPEIQAYYLNNDIKQDRKVEFKTINLKHESLKDSMEQVRQEIQQIFL